MKSDYLFLKYHTGCPMEKGLGQREGQHGRKKIRYKAITLIVQTGNVGDLGQGGGREE